MEEDAFRFRCHWSLGWCRNSHTLNPLTAGALRRLKRDSRTITKRERNSDIGAEANGSSIKRLTEVTGGKLSLPWRSCFAGQLRTS